LNPGRARLFASPETAQAVAGARAAVVLVGGYDGSGNYGDIVLLEAALGLLERLGPTVLALPVLERRHLTGHRVLRGEEGRTGESPVLFYDPGEEGEYDDGLLPVPAPVELAFGATYLYGGGYLNRLWGARKLAMLDAADALLAAGGEVSCRLSSGLQVEPGWVDCLAGGGGVFAGLELRGARDDASQEELSRGQGSPALNTGDDAVGFLGRLPRPANSPADDGRLLVNVHFAEHGWVTERSRELFDLYVSFIAEVGRLGGRPVRVQPVIAYLDSRQDERRDLARLGAACVAEGMEVAEPLLLRPAGLTAAQPQLGAGALTLSCSYHVALTSLMLGVPAILIGDNRYYEQKAAGLLRDFELPGAFSRPASTDPGSWAAEIAETVLDQQRARALRQSLTANAERLRQRRAAVEIELLGRLGGGVATALDSRVDDLAARIRQLADEPAELHVRLAHLQSEVERLRCLAESPLDAELRAQEAEARAAAAHDVLEGVLRSRSWRLLAPLRRLKALLGRG
jgi:polysaccharide pyruvyl transferase WcaK-like protein